WTSAAIAAQRQVLATLASHGISVRVDQSFARVINGFSATLDSEASSLLERLPEVAGVYPVRVAYPATISSALLAKDELARGAALPIRVAGWRPDASGGWAVYSRTDQLIKGLERAVDPNEDGDAHDAARIALVGLAAPYASFADAPDARAVEGALNLDTLVVAAAGNDGPGGPAFGTLSGPGGAPAALAVGAADLRSETGRGRIVVRG